MAVPAAAPLQAIPAALPSPDRTGKGQQRRHSAGVGSHHIYCELLVLAGAAAAAGYADGRLSVAGTYEADIVAVSAPGTRVLPSCVPNYLLLSDLRTQKAIVCVCL